LYLFRDIGQPFSRFQHRFGIGLLFFSHSVIPFSLFRSEGHCGYEDGF